MRRHVERAAPSRAKSEKSSSHAAVALPPLRAPPTQPLHTLEDGPHPPAGASALLPLRIAARVQGGTALRVRQGGRGDAGRGRGTGLEVVCVRDESLSFGDKLFVHKDIFNMPFCIDGSGLMAIAGGPSGDVRDYSDGTRDQLICTRTSAQRHHALATVA